jgi:hypothetical protein
MSERREELVNEFCNVLKEYGETVQGNKPINADKREELLIHMEELRVELNSTSEEEGERCLSV